MTHDAAVAAAQAQARMTNSSVAVWGHVGGHGVPITFNDRFMIRSVELPPPKFERWEKLETYSPAGAKKRILKRIGRKKP